jgi:hypothetical protein
VYIFGGILFFTTVPPVMVALGSATAWRHFVHWVIASLEDGRSAFAVTGHDGKCRICSSCMMGL